MGPLPTFATGLACNLASDRIFSARATDSPSSPLTDIACRVSPVSEHRPDSAELEALKQRFLEMVERDPDPDVSALFDEVIRRRFGTMIARAALTPAFN